MAQRNDARDLGDRGRPRRRSTYRPMQTSTRAQTWGWFDLFIVIILATLVVTLVR